MNVFVPRGRYATILQNEKKIASGKKFHLKKISIQGKENPRNSKVLYIGFSSSERYF